MIDVQSEPDGRGIHIDSVGIRDVRYPITVYEGPEPQRTIATAAISVRVPDDVRGTHLSRLVEILDTYAAHIDAASISSLLDSLCGRLDAQSASADLTFTYSTRRAAPVTGASACATFEALFSGSKDRYHETISMGIQVPVTTVCPCSKAISDYGAHNQRGTVTIEVALNQQLDGQYPTFAALIEIAEASASAPVYPLVKRPDERFLTMKAFDHPLFVEDVIRGCSLELQLLAGADSFRVEVTTQESIHSHNAFASIGWSPTDATTARNSGRTEQLVQPMGERFRSAMQPFRAQPRALTDY